MKNHKLKIALCVLLILAVSLFVISLCLKNKDEQDITESGTSGDIIVLNGWWEDLWGIPEEINVYGTLHAGDYNTTVSSNSYTNKDFGYTAPSGFGQLQIMSPNNNSWSITVLANRYMLSNSNTNGWYYFRGYKPSPKGDYTKASAICLDTVKPQIQTRVNGSTVLNGTVTTSSSAVISVLGSDTLSGVNTYWYSTNGGSTYYQCYASSTFSSDGKYTFYCVDRAGNVSDIVTVIKDTTAPTFGAYNGTTKLANGATVSAASLRFEASDSTSGLDGIYIRVPSSSSYTKYASSSVTLSAEGLYYYYARDNAGNQTSTYTVIIDRTVPNAQLYSENLAVSNNYYSNASYIRFTASDANGCTCYIKKDGGSYSVYTSGTNITAEGVYSFYAVDTAKNTTST